jgi:urease accessory protein
MTHKPGDLPFATTRSPSAGRQEVDDDTGRIKALTSLSHPTSTIGTPMTFIRLSLPLAALSLLAFPATALAHTGIGSTDGLLHGFAHPLGGLDHILAMVGVGLLAARLGGRALWLVPAAFVAMMAVGGAAGMYGHDLPWVEAGIALSIVVLGLAVAFNLSLPALGAASVVGFFAIFHGHAHGAEMPADISGLGYALGFVLATATLHVTGIAFGLGLDRFARAQSARIAQVIGGAAALAGIGLLAGAI